MRKLNRELGITVVFITHFMEEAALADRVVVMDKGSIAASGTPAEIFADTALLRRTGLELPPAAMLARTLREQGIALDGDTLTPEQCTDALFRAAQKAGAV